MRKVDYQTLAHLVREGRAFSLVQRDSADATDEGRRYHQGRADSLAFLARSFAERASVDRAEFLRACGLD